MKILFTTPILEYPAAGGPQLRIENSIKALSRVCELHILHQAQFRSDTVDFTNAYFSEFSSNYMTAYRYPRNRILRIGLKILKKLSGIRFDRTESILIKYIIENEIDIVWFGFGNISFPLIKSVKKSLPKLKVVCDTDSVWSRFILREMPFAGGRRRRKIELAGKQKKEEEKAWVNLCEVTTAVSQVDAEYYRSISNEPKRIHLFSNVIDLDTYKETPPPPKGFVKPCIFLAGSFGPNSAMNMAAEWILDEVMPILQVSFPGLHLYLVGRGSDREFAHRAGPTITVTGKVESVLPYLLHSDVALVPLKFESGTRFKILEAGACRIPLVSTTLGAEGIPVVDGKHILIADQPKEFAAEIIKLLNDRLLRKVLAENCFQLIESQYSIESLVSEADSILKYIEND